MKNIISNLTTTKHLDTLKQSKLTHMKVPVSYFNRVNTHSLTRKSFSPRPQTDHIQRKSY